MNSKQKIVVNDFNLFADVIKATSKIVDSAKISVNENGLEIYGSRGKLTRCEMTSNSITSDKPIDMYIEKLDMLCKILATVKEIHKDDYSDFTFTFDTPKLNFSSKKFKTKFQTQTADKLEQWLGKKIETELKPEFEFTTTSDLIKRINGHSFIFTDQNNLRIYLETKDDMEKNTLFATIGNKASELNNEITLKFAVVNSGVLNADRKLILDLEHLNLFNALQSNEIKIFLPEKYNMLVSKVKVLGKNDSYFNMNIYNAVLKS